MKIVRYLPSPPTALMSLMNLPSAFDDGGAGIPTPLAWGPSTLLGVAGWWSRWPWPGRVLGRARPSPWAGEPRRRVAALIQQSDGP
jgi:hypothetical protein